MAKYPKNPSGKQVLRSTCSSWVAIAFFKYLIEKESKNPEIPTGKSTFSRVGLRYHSILSRSAVDRTVRLFPPQFWWFWYSAVLLHHAPSGCVGTTIWLQISENSGGRRRRRLVTATSSYIHNNNNTIPDLSYMCTHHAPRRTVTKSQLISCQIFEPWCSCVRASERRKPFWID